MSTRGARHREQRERESPERESEEESNAGVEGIRSEVGEEEAGNNNEHTEVLFRLTPYSNTLDLTTEICPIALKYSGELI